MPERQNFASKTAGQVKYSLAAPRQTYRKVVNGSGNAKNRLRPLRQNTLRRSQVIYLLFQFLEGLQDATPAGSFRVGTMVPGHGCWTAKGPVGFAEGNFYRYGISG